MAPEAHLNDGPAGTPLPSFLQGDKGRLLYCQRWEPWPGDETGPHDTAPGAGPGSNPDHDRAPVVLVHGFGEHVGRYENLGRALAASGFTLHAMDLPGFGRSDGPRALVDSLDSAVADIGRLVASAGDGRGPRPVLLGHSMGGAFAAAYALGEPGSISGLVLSAPALNLASRPKWQVLPVMALSRVAPHTGVGRIAPAKLSRDSEAVAQYIADPLVWHGSVPARTAMAMYDAGRLVMKRAGEIKVPLFVLHGEADGIVPVTSSRQFSDAAGSADKHLRTFKGLLHEVFQEVGKQEVVAILVEWLRRHQR